MRQSNRFRLLAGLGVLLLTTSGTPVFAQSPRPETSTRFGTLPLPVAMEAMPGVTRDALTKVMKAPTVTAVATAEEFVAHWDMYQWLLDHPDRTAGAWRKLGVGAVEITPLKDGRFLWKDELGSELVWQSVARSPQGRIWYAEGKFKPAILSPTFPVTGVAVLNHSAKARAGGESAIKHQVELFLQADNKAATLATKVLGDTAPKITQQGGEQLLAFFAGIARYSHDKPEKAVALFEEKSSKPTEKRR